ncbi:energy transducer TonB [Thermodesulfobacteriota bacterium]
MIRLVPFFCVSLLFHVFVLGATNPWGDRATSPGLPDGYERLFVEVVAQQELTAAAPTPSAVDAAASAESQPNDEPTAPEEPPEEEPPVEEEPETEPVPDQEDPSPPVLATKTEEPKADFVDSDQPTKEDKEETDEDTQEETPDSTASMAQIASRQSVFKASRGKDLADLKARVIAAIKKASYYPRKSARRKERGEVIVSFRLWKDGRVDGIEIRRSSGSEILDEAAVKTMRKAAKDFPKLPQSLRVDHLVYAVPIVFKGKGNRR